MQQKRMALFSICEKNSKRLYFLNYTYYSTFFKEHEYKKYYQKLGISETSDQESVRRAYLSLVKKYHPDSGGEEADVKKFQEIDEAFRLLINKKSKERWDVEDIKSEHEDEYDIEHIIPQHRQYLNHGGMGQGTPFQREKQYVNYRAMKAAENLLEHRIGKATANDKALMDKTANHKIKTRYDFDRLVEDLIQEAMSKGEFNNLSGTGKPLPQSNTNPYVDYATHKLNQVLIDNGFTPQWITLQKEIREEVQALRENLRTERKYFGPFPLSTEDNIDWSETVQKHRKTINDINKKINKYNLLVPLLDKQLFSLSLEKEAQNAMVNGESSASTNYQNIRKTTPEISEKRESIFSIIGSFFGK